MCGGIIKIMKINSLNAPRAWISFILNCTVVIRVSAQLAAQYPNDIGIENDPDILYVEKFDDGLPSILSRYDDAKNTAGMSLDTDVPPGSKNPYSLKLTNIGGENSGGHLYKHFVPGFDSTVYLRYYVKYPLISKGYIHHESVWIGGYNPGLPWPYPRAGICGLGDTRISVAYEPIGKETMNTYMYWGDMHHDPNNNCWGNLMIAGDSIPSPIPYDKWLCVELMVKLNDPVSSYNGELRIWHDGKETGYWGSGFPNGSWTWDRFIARDTAPPFEGFRWRTDPKLNLNYIWIEYYDDTSPSGVSHYIKYDHIVIARKRIGPIYDPASTVDATYATEPIHISPNPASDHIVVALPREARMLTIYTMLGTKVYSATGRQVSEINVSHLPAGLYFVEVQLEQVVTRSTLIKQ
jgi:hypothetical protein